MLDELITEELNNDHLTMKPKDKANSPLQKFFNQRCVVSVFCLDARLRLLCIS